MRTLIFLAFASALLVRSAFGLEATFTPAEGQGAQDAGGPLPQSQNQRDQLLQLEDAILNSPNPQETLIEVAKANSMQPQDLVDLLQRNRADMEMAAGGGTALGARAGPWLALERRGDAGAPVRRGPREGDVFSRFDKGGTLAELIAALNEALV